MGRLLNGRDERFGPKSRSDVIQIERGCWTYGKATARRVVNLGVSTVLFLYPPARQEELFQAGGIKGQAVATPAPLREHAWDVSRAQSNFGN